MNFITRNIRLVIFMLLVLISFVFISYNYMTAPYTSSFFALDTFVNINLCGRGAKKCSAMMEHKVHEIENTFSAFRNSSEVVNINNALCNEEIPSTAQVTSLIKKSNLISEQTNGDFDITIGALTNLWDIKNATSPPSPDSINENLLKVGYEKLYANDTSVIKYDEITLDFGGIAKGYAADEVRKIASQMGITKGIVNLGGNICAIGSKDDNIPWTIGIASPFDVTSTFLTVDITDSNVITSGAYQRYFEYNGIVYHHIISPKTGMPSNSDIASATVISKDGALADALSTTIFIQGSIQAMKTLENFGVEGIIITKSGEVIATKNINWKLIQS